MIRHPGETRLNDYADGLLPADDARAVEAHLATCGACRHRVEMIRDLMDELRALPREIAPPRDLRPPAASRRAPERSFRLPRPWLRAAAVVVLLLGGAALVRFAGDRPAGPETAVAERGTAGDATAVAAAVPLEPYSEAARELLTTFRVGRTRLDPEAVRLIRRSLAVVDAAIRELERARARAPDDARIPRLLEARYRTKLELLRDAVALISKA